MATETAIETAPTGVKENFAALLEESLGENDSLEGTVVINVLIEKDGRPSRATVVKSVAEILDEAAVAAVMKQRFEPARQRNRPVRVEMAIPVHFRLTTAEK